MSAFNGITWEDDWDEEPKVDCGDPDCWCADDSVDSITSAKENSMNGTQSSLVGQRSSTGNSFINSLPQGTILEVVDQGVVEVLDVIDSEPEVVAPVVTNFKKGDRILTKHGASTVLRLTSRLSESGAGLEEDDILYIADGTNVVRVANREDVSAL